MGEFESGSVKNAVEGFHLLENRVPNLAARFSPGYEGTDNMFYFFYKIIIVYFNKEKNFIRCAYVYLHFFPETVTSHNLETEATILPRHFRVS